MHWSLSVAPQARVEKIVAEGYYQQFVSGVPPGAKVSTYYRYPEAGVDALYNTTEPGHLYTLFQNVGRLTGKRPMTLQVRAVNGRVTVDGVASAVQPAPGTAFEHGRPVTVALTPMSGSRSEDELSASFCCEQTYTTSKAIRSVGSAVLSRCRVMASTGSKLSRYYRNTGSRSGPAVSVRRLDVVRRQDHARPL